jgi:hypothetical protein
MILLCTLNRAMTSLPLKLPSVETAREDSLACSEDALPEDLAPVLLNEQFLIPASLLLSKLPRLP